MNYKKYLSFIISFIFVLNFLSVGVYAHPGSLDSNGGHYNRKTGEYHYHSGTNQSNSSSGTVGNSKVKEEPKELSGFTKVFVMIGGGILVISLIGGMIVGSIAGIAWFVMMVKLFIDDIILDKYNRKKEKERKNRK